MCPCGEGFGAFCSIVHLYGKKNCALRGKSIKLSTMIVLVGLIIFSYEPHPNTHGGRHNVPLGEGFGLFYSIVIYMVKKLCT